MVDRVVACRRAEAAERLGCPAAARRPLEASLFGPEIVQLVLQNPGIVYERPINDANGRWEPVESSAR